MHIHPQAQKSKIESCQTGKYPSFQIQTTFTGKQTGRSLEVSSNGAVTGLHMAVLTDPTLCLSAV